MESKYNFVYKTTNNINGKIYIGVHKTDNIDDGYIGSGSILKRAIKKYGKENFKREILKHFEKYHDALLYEAELVTEEFIKEVTNYNLKTGGKQNIRYSEELLSAMSKRTTLMWESGELEGLRVRLSNMQKELWSNDEYRKKMIAIFNSDERKEKLSIGIKKWIEENPELHYERMMKINKNPEKIRKMAEKQTGRPQTKERRDNISKSLMGKFKGEQNNNFLGWYVTPFGKFSSLKEAADTIGNSPVCVRDRCIIKNQNKVVKYTTIVDDKITEDMIGKTWCELGWSFEGKK